MSLAEGKQPCRQFDVGVGRAESGGAAPQFQLGDSKIQLAGWDDREADAPSQREQVWFCWRIDERSILFRLWGEPT